MRVTVDYLDNGHYVSIVTDEPNSQDWNDLIRVLPVQFEVSDDHQVIFPWSNFLPILGDLAQYLDAYGIEVVVTARAKFLLEKAEDNSYDHAITKLPYDHSVVIDLLRAKGFKRVLTRNQLDNVCSIAQLPGCATFSVPGAGKTTEALAYFFLNANESTRLLVVAPKNVFPAWDEQLLDCIGLKDVYFTRLVGGKSRIQELLLKNPKYMIINYAQFQKVPSLMSRLLANNEIIMFLDESHKIKGNNGKISKAILSVSNQPFRKMIMSGTPMPQSAKDLLPQFRFLYPEKIVDETNVVNLFQPIFVRTTQDQLNIPKVEFRRERIRMEPMQSEIYDLIKSETKRNIKSFLDDTAKDRLRKMGKNTMRLMQFVSNPSLLSFEMAYIFDPKLGEMLLHCSGPKIDYACKRARELAAEGKKVIIWSCFVRNVELIACRLRDLGAVYIHGGVDVGDANDPNTRESRIREFHENPECMVLVANPAAASEGISLHTVCQYAIYVDRSFNAAQYLQSIDRIHRLGLKLNQKPVVEIIECIDTIDEVIETRLNVKVTSMAVSLNDPSLNVTPYIVEDYDDSDVDISEYFNNEIDMGDYEALYNYFFGDGS